MVLGVCNANAQASPFKTVPRTSETELQNQKGEVQFWVDKMGRTHSPDIMLQQKAYNDWIYQSFHTSFGIGPGMSAPEGIQLVAAQPPGERGINSNGVFQVPDMIIANGVLTRDTCAIEFYKSGIKWNWAARQLLSDCKGVKSSNDSTVNCNRYDIGLSTSDQPRTPPRDDTYMLEKRYVELQDAKKSLAEWQALLDSIVTVSASGKRADAAQDRAETAVRKQSWGGDYDADGFTNPPDWMTAQVDAKQLTPGFRQQLANAEKDVLDHLIAEKTAKDLGQEKARRNRTN
jgi:hypothetical protein